MGIFKSTIVDTIIKIFNDVIQKRNNALLLLLITISFLNNNE